MQEQSTRAKRGKPSVPVTCQTCGSGFLTWAYKIANGGARFCSDPCYRTSRRTGRSGPSVTVMCPVCTREFLTWPYRIKKGTVYCSPVCEHESLRRGEQRTCRVCGRSFYFAAYRQRSGQAGLFCSNRCNGTGVRVVSRKSSTRNSADYRDWRLAVYRRDDYTCQRCSKRGGHDLHAHHIKGWTRYPSLRFDLANGLTLCHPCHTARHQEYGWK